MKKDSVVNFHDFGYSLLEASKPIERTVRVKL